VPELDQQIRAIIAEQLRVELGRVTPEKAIVGDLWADSLAVVELTAALEDAFGIEVPAAEVPMLRTVGDVLCYVRERVAERTAREGSAAPAVPGGADR
jgi:acyl carrier protein